MFQISFFWENYKEPRVYGTNNIMSVMGKLWDHKRKRFKEGALVVWLFSQKFVVIKVKGKLSV